MAVIVGCVEMGLGHVGFHKDLGLAYQRFIRGNVGIR